jgi:sugar-phosphatase
VTAGQSSTGSPDVLTQEPEPDRSPPLIDGLDALVSRGFAAVLFDLDGTLIDSTPSVERSWATWAGTYGLTLADLQGWHGVPARGLIAHFLPPEQHAEAEQAITDLEIADVEGIAALPGAASFLDALAGTGRSAIVTSGVDRLARARIQVSGLTAPDVVVTASDVVHGKPSPDPYVLAAQRLGVDPGACLVVEDAPAGLAAARAAGCATLAVTTTTAYADLVADPNADAVVPTLAYVRAVVGDDGVRIVRSDLTT